MFNAIKVKGNAVGDVMFYGRGAGKLPTASAVVADVIAAARQMDRAGYRPWQPNRPDAVFSPDELSSQWYVRLASGGAGRARSSPSPTRRPGRAAGSPPP